MKTIIYNGTAILPDRLLDDAVIIIDGGRIVSVKSGGRIPANTHSLNARGGYISPGFVDIHVHGGAGADFMDGTVQAVKTVCAAHARHGTTTIFPTTTTGEFDQIMAMIDACRTVQSEGTDHAGSRIAGVHLYGPYFAEDKTGCHPRDECRPPVAKEFDRYFQTQMIRIATCAAELPGAIDFYKVARRRKCLVTCGHSNSSWQEMALAFRAGMRHVDHFWCAMSNVSSVRQRLGVPMQGSMTEFVLANAEMSTEVIADGMHLSPELLHFAAMMKGPSRLCLVTDCNRAMDMPSGRYRFGNEHSGTWFESDGRVGWATEGSLASSVNGMDHMVRQMISATKLPLPEVIRMASLTPAERAGIANETGSIEVGKSADILLLSRRLLINQVMVHGRRIV
ncbi:MAG: amidohydrolase family protein [Planctomycetaceae bacterium]